MPTIVDNTPTRSNQPIRMRLQQGVPVIDDKYEWIVKGDHVPQNKMEILSTTGIPIMGVTPSPTGFGICVGKDARFWPQKPLYWTVSADFSTNVEQGQDNPDPTTPPEAWIPVYQQKMRRIEELFSKDAAGTVYANSAGYRFGGLTRPRYLPVWDIYQFESTSVTDEQVIDRAEKTNSAVFKGRAINTLLLTVQDSTVGYFYGQLRRYTQYQLVYKKDEWTVKKRDVGPTYVDSGQVLAYTTDDGKVTYDGNLNGSGAKQTQGVDAAELEFDLFEKIAFSFLRT